MVSNETREFLGTLSTRGWRNFLMWGMSLVLLMLGFAFVYRFAVGTLSGADFVALAGVVGPLLYGQHTRSAEVRAGVANAGPPTASPIEGRMTPAPV